MLLPLPPPLDSFPLPPLPFSYMYFTVLLLFHCPSYPLSTTPLPLPCLSPASPLPLPCLYPASTLPLPCLYPASTLPLPCSCARLHSCLSTFSSRSTYYCMHTLFLLFWEVYMFSLPTVSNFLRSKCFSLDIFSSLLLWSKLQRKIISCREASLYEIWWIVLIILFAESVVVIEDWSTAIAITMYVNVVLHVHRGRNRHMDQGFDLDLTYITERIIGKIIHLAIFY